MSTISIYSSSSDNNNNITTEATAATSARRMSLEDEYGASQMVRQLRNTFITGKTRPIQWRKQQLRAMRKMLKENVQLFNVALADDLANGEFFTEAIEITGVLTEIDFALRNINDWIKPESLTTLPVLQPAKSYIVREPLGVVLIMGAWNYPISLVLSPLVGAIAAGNCAIIKPSEISQSVSSLFAKLVPRYLDPAAIQVFEGGIPETTALLNCKFDHIFYTGNSTVGRIVMTAAAKHLTPVTLELGGKSPVYIDKDVDLDVAVRRVVFGRFFNCGQTCIAPDYALVHKEVLPRFLEAAVRQIRVFYGPNPQNSQDYSRIINKRHLQRIEKLLKSSDGELVTGGIVDENDLYISPTIVKNPSHFSPLMSEEIFGPILPVISVQSEDDAMEFIQRRPKPLACYVFSTQKMIQKKFVQEVSAGSCVINDVVMQYISSHMPFGGVGESGMGAYHGKKSFETFSHAKSVLHKSTWLDLDLRYPPYNHGKKVWLMRLRHLDYPSPRLVCRLLYGGISAVVIAAIVITLWKKTQNTLKPGTAWWYIWVGLTRIAMYFFAKKDKLQNKIQDKLDKRIATITTTTNNNK